MKWADQSAQSQFFTDDHNEMLNLLSQYFDEEDISELMKHSRTTHLSYDKVKFTEEEMVAA